MENNLKHFENLIKQQIDRVESIKQSSSLKNFDSLNNIVIGIIPGDGIGPTIMTYAEDIIETLLEDDIKSGKIIIKKISGLTLENRIAKMETVPKDVLAEIKKCDVILKGPTTTPGKGDNLPNIESANVTLRRELDLFANVRPVTVPEKNIAWTFFRENTEGEYTLGNQGIDISDDIAIDFKVTTDIGTKRLAKSAFEYAKNNSNLNVSIITKANIIKKTDGKFLSICYDVAKDYPDIKVDDWYVDICAANLINNNINSKFNVFILPNLYGDIITDEAAQIQGGVGTAGSANIGNTYAMFEAIHGSAPRMVQENLQEYANPASLIKALEMLLRHIGYISKANQLSVSLEKSTLNFNMTGDKNGDTGKHFTEFLIHDIRGGK